MVHVGVLSRVSLRHLSVVVMYSSTRKSLTDKLKRTLNQGLLGGVRGDLHAQCASAPAELLVQTTHGTSGQEIVHVAHEDCAGDVDL